MGGLAKTLDSNDLAISAKSKNFSDELIGNTFSYDSTTVITIEELKKHIVLDRGFGNTMENMISGGFLDTMYVRDLYTAYSFPLITEDLLLSIKLACQTLGIKKLCELACGQGWLTYWLRKKGVPIIAAVDNFTWERFSKENQCKYADIEKMDAVKAVRKYLDVDAYILSWPPMDTMAYKIWDKMKAGQYLIYIGEGSGGCTADDKFFDAVDGCWLDYKEPLAHAAFFGIHDFLMIFKKPEKKRFLDI